MGTAGQLGGEEVPGPDGEPSADLGVPLVNDVRITGVGLHPFGRFGETTGTAMGVVAVRAALAESGIGVRDVQAAFCGTAYGGVAAGHRVLSSLAGHRHPHLRRRGRLRLGWCGPAARRGVHRLGTARPGAGLRDREDAQGHHPLVVLRPVAGGGRTQPGAGLLRPPGPTAAGRDRPDRGPPGSGGGQEPPPRRRQPRRHVPQGGDGRGGPGLADDLSAPHPVHAVLPQRGRGRRGPRTPTGDGVRAGRDLPAVAPPRQRPRRGLTPLRHRRHRHHAADDAGRRRRLRPGRPGPRRRRRGGVPGHRRRPRAAGLGRARTVPARRSGRPAGRRCGRGRRSPPGQPVRRPAVQGGAARRLGPGPGGGAGPPAAGYRRRPAGGRGTGGAGPRDRTGRQRLRHRPGRQFDPRHHGYRLPAIPPWRPHPTATARRRRSARRRPCRCRTPSRGRASGSPPR